MERTVLRGWPWLLLLLLLWVSGFPAVGEEEDEICLLEGRNLTAVCTYNIMLYATSLKAWQRVGSQGPAETLVRTTTKYTDRNWARAGRYLLEDDPTNGGLVVTVTGLQRQDLGLYQCVIDLSPQKPKELFPRIRLVQCRDHSSTPASDKNPSRGLAQISTLPPLTFNTQSKLPTSPRTETPLLPMTTASLSSPGLEVNPTHKTDVIRYGFQVSGPLVCTRSPLVSSPCAERMWGVKGEEGWGTGADLSHLSLVEPPRGGRGRC
ncbi:PREDICTED: triggering receptor expressed on myeloid cells 1 isoform X2 [Hipposideros armiger]|uniref:Triggering receptor expressed on myeloid cells 1 isoform X2 n=1 Tax=Hipposideros armiger TaxID=186990 RepID=A0A8B7QS36_HIPAR|nr:PREDICTED: triggering receptor expressed on myeloid cells 1 isoform X2 [Hipposideros armiger]